jgi:rod shape-determining protein MreB
MKLSFPRSFSEVTGFFSTGISRGLSRKIGIDLGTSRVRIWSDTDGIIVDEPSYIAVDTGLGKVLAVGQEAQEMIGRVVQGVEVSAPLRAGVVLQPELAIAMLKVFLQKILQTSYFFRPVMMVSVPANLTEVEKKALTEILYSLGAREVYFVHQLLAGAIGAGVPIADASGSFLLQMGSGIVEGGIISLGSLIVSEVTPYAGNYLDDSIQRLLRKELRLHVGKKTVEQLKKQVGSARKSSHKEIQVIGQDVLSASPKEEMISSELLFPPIQQLIERYVRVVKKLFQHTPSELTSDVIDKGVLLSGGFAQLDGLDTELLGVLGVPVALVDDAEHAVIKGIAQVLENLELFKESIGYRDV